MRGRKELGRSSARLAIEIDRSAIEEFCDRWKIVEFSFFGSALRDDFGPDSDVDVLVTFLPDAPWSLMDLVRIGDDLAAIIGRRVDLVERAAVERSENWIRRNAILDSAEPYFAAR